MINILVLEDDMKLNQAVCTYLNDSGFRAKGCLNAKEAYDELYNNLYELIISDIMMPEIDGFEFAETIRRVNKHIPILFMSAKDDLPSKQKGFQLGIDDYMVKPVELDELLLRVRALLRRANIEMERKLVAGNLELDADAMTAVVNAEEIPVTTREFNILYKLLSYPNKTFSRAQLMDQESVSEEKRKEYVQNILKASKRLSNLIINMLKLNKLEKQTIQSASETYDLCRQLCDCALQFEDVWEKKTLILKRIWKKKLRSMQMQVCLNWCGRICYQML